MERKLTISFLQNGDVSYGFCRGRALRRYLVEYPSEKVILENETNLERGGYRKTITAEGFMELTWQTPYVYAISYIKQGKLISEPGGYRYKEKIRIKGKRNNGEFYLWIPSKKAMDIRKSIFSTNSSQQNFPLKQSGEYIFYERGIWDIDWLVRL